MENDDTKNMSFHKKDEKKRIDEAIFKNSPLERANNCFTRVSRSICKTEVGNKNQGTGFFIKLKANNNENYKYFLMTCEHVIKRELIHNENIEIEIEINYDSGFKKLRIKLDRYERIIRTFEEIIDLTLIEIIQDDNIGEDYFLEPNYKYNEKKVKYSLLNILLFLMINQIIQIIYIIQMEQF